MRLGDLEISDVKYGDYMVNKIYIGNDIVYDNASRYMIFADSVVKEICVNNWGSNGEITYGQAAMVSTLSNKFYYNNTVTMFNELQYFTGLTSLGAGFDTCTKLASVIIPNNITLLPSLCFEDCRLLTNVTLPSNLTAISKGCFIGCNLLNNIILPNSVTTIGGMAFYGCISLESVILPTSLISLDYSCFQGCSTLSSITMFNSLESIGDGCFSHCKLINVALPISIIQIMDYAFYDCADLTSVTVFNTTPPILGANVFTGHNNIFTIYVPASSLSAYQSAPGWSAYASYMTGI